jgi:alkanesulfonate monooxygenase SsuD/methylene tetrahydromethanopterin reductase-like flavin-dependent oxidoreductase (luciferase family)
MRRGLMLRAQNGAARAAIELASTAEDAGFDTVYVTESHLGSARGFANAFAVAAAMSGRLRRASIGVLPALGMEHPLRLVEQANMLNLLTDGRSLVVLSDSLEPRQYAAFGLPVPRNGLLEELVQDLEDAWAWSWNYQEDGPPLEFHSGPYASKMAGRIMPAACPRVAFETDSEAGVRDAAIRGRPLHLRAASLELAKGLLETYREVVTSVGHTPRVVQDCLDGLTVVVGHQFPWSIPELETMGVAEVRFDVAPEPASGILR